MAACGYPGEPGPPAGAQQMALAGFPDTGIQMLKSGFERRRRIAIRDSAAWLTFWDTLVLLLPPPKPLAPPVNFDEDMVIAVAKGRNPEPEPTAAAAIGSAARIMLAAGGDSIALAEGPPWFAIYIDAVHEFGEDLWVAVRMVESGRECGIPRLWTPAVAVRVPRRDGYVTWMDRLESVDC